MVNNTDLFQGYNYKSLKRNLETSRNPYLDSYIKFNTGEICYVTINGIVRKMSNDSWTYSPGQAGCPGSNKEEDYNFPWLPQYDIPGTVISTSPTLISGEPMNQKYESCAPPQIPIKNMKQQNFYEPTKVNNLLSESDSLIEQYKIQQAEVNRLSQRQTELQQKINGQITSQPLVPSTYNKNYFVDKVVSDISYNYQGCYQSSTKTPVLQNQSQYPVSNLNQCFNYSVDNGFSFFGIGNWNDASGLGTCYAGANGPLTDQATLPTCITGSDNNKYGGPNTIAVYKVPTAEYVGTFGDAPKRAIPQQSGNSNSLTFQDCFNTANTTPGISLFGLQDTNSSGTGGQCFLGSDFNNALQYGPATNGITGVDGYQYGGPWSNAIYTLSTSANYIGCYNFNSTVSANLTLISSVNNLTDCISYAKENKYTYFGLQNYINNKSTCYFSNSLEAFQVGGQQQCSTLQNRDNVGNSASSSVYTVNLPPNSNPSLLGNVAYVDSSGQISNPYAPAQLGFLNTYKKKSNTFSTIATGSGGNIQTLEQCQTSCSDLSNCYGFSYNQATGICNSYNQNNLYQSLTPNTNYDTYIRNPKVANPPLGVSPDVHPINSVMYSEFTPTGQPPNASYNLAAIIGADKQEIIQVGQRILELTASMDTLKQKLITNIDNLNDQSYKDYTGTKDYLNEYNSLSENLVAEQATKGNLNRIITENEIVLNHNNTTYLMWGMLALGGLIILLGIFTKIRKLKYN